MQPVTPPVRHSCSPEEVARALGMRPKAPTIVAPTTLIPTPEERFVLDRIYRGEPVNPDDPVLAELHANGWVIVNQNKLLHGLTCRGVLACKWKPPVDQEPGPLVSPEEHALLASVYRGTEINLPVLVQDQMFANLRASGLLVQDRETGSHGITGAGIRCMHEQATRVNDLASQEPERDAQENPELPHPQEVRSVWTLILARLEERANISTWGPEDDEWAMSNLSRMARIHQRAGYVVAKQEELRTMHEINDKVDGFIANTQADAARRVSQFRFSVLCVGLALGYAIARLVG